MQGLFPVHACCCGLAVIRPRKGPSNEGLLRWPTTCNLQVLDLLYTEPAVGNCYSLWQCLLSQIALGASLVEIGKGECAAFKLGVR